MVRISDSSIDDLAGTSVTDPTKVRVLTANIQASTPGSSQDMGLNDIQYVVQSHLLTATSHGLVAGDEGKPLSGVAVYDDLDGTQAPDWILLQVVDANTLRVMPPGGIVTINNTLLEGGASYNLAADRHAYWDKDAGKYQASSGRAAYDLAILSVGATTFTAVLAYRSTSDAYEVRVRGSGVAAVDNVRFGAAFDQITANGGGVIWIEGTVQLSTSKNFLVSNLSIRGVPGTNPKIEFVGTTKIGVNYNYTVFTDTEVAITAAVAGAAEIVCPTGTVAEGEWFFVKSDDNITGVQTTSPQTYRSLEMHFCAQIAAQNGGNDYIFFEDFIVDPLTTNPKMIVPTIYKNIEFRDFDIGWASGTEPNSGCIDLRCCAHVRVDNLRWAGIDSPNQIQFNYCADVDVSNLYCENKRRRGESSGYAYGIVCGVTNGFRFRDSFMFGSRHIWTTGVEDDGANNRYGTPRNVKVSNVIGKTNGTDADQGLVIFDTHAEGYGIEFNNCTAVLPAEEGNPVTHSASVGSIGFTTRARRTIYNNCKVIGEGQSDTSTFGFRVLAEDCVIQNCLADGCWYGVEIKYLASNGQGNHRCIVNGFVGTNMATAAIVIREDSDHVIKNLIAQDCAQGVRITNGGLGSTPSDVSISHSKFIRCSSNGIDLEAGTGHKISFCDFEDCGTSGDASAVFMASGTTATIDHSNLRKYSNSFAVGGNAIDSGDVVLRNCTLTGYADTAGVEDTGFDTTNSASADLHYESLMHNHFDATGGASGVFGGIEVESNVTETAISLSSSDFTNKVKIAVFNTNSPSYAVTPDQATDDDLTIHVPGTYEVSANVSFSGGLSDTYSFALFKNGGTTQLGPRFTRKLGTGGDVGSASLSAIAALAKNDTVELWCQNEDGTDNLTVEDACLTVKKV